MLVGDIHEQQVLHDGGAHVAIGKTFGERGRGAKLIGRDAPAQDGGADIRESGLLLSVNTDVVAIDVGRRIFVFGRIELEADAIFEFGEETIRSVIRALRNRYFRRACLRFCRKLVAGAKDLGYAARYCQHLFGPDERIQSHSKMRLGGKAAADANRESGFSSAKTFARNGGEADVVDLGIRAPDAAAGDGHLEFARKVVELGVAGKMAIKLQCNR